MATAEVLFDPLLPEFRADPYPFYRRLREQGPVHRSPLGFWLLTRYDDCVNVLRDPRFGREERRAPRLAVAEASPEWRQSSVLRGLKRLRVSF